MTPTYYAKKLGMSQIYTDGRAIPVTLLQAEQNTEEAFSEGARVRIVGVSKGKGFQGVVKRWRFAGAPASHGTKHVLRAPGSIGSRFPQHTRKGRKMPGRMGGNQTTVVARLVKIDQEQHVFMVNSPVPGPRGTRVALLS